MADIAVTTTTLELFVVSRIVVYVYPWNSFFKVVYLFQCLTQMLRGNPTVSKHTHTHAHRHTHTDTHTHTHTLQTQKL